jgi:hypothetical protein
MINKTYPWILIDKANMGKLRLHFHNSESVAYAMMKSGTIRYRDFSEFIIIKNEKEIVDLKSKMAGVGGDAISIHNKVTNILETA